MQQNKLFYQCQLAIATLLSLINPNDTYQLPFEPEKIIRYNPEFRGNRALLSSQTSSNTASYVIDYETSYTTGSPKVSEGFSNHSNFPVYEIGVKQDFINFCDRISGFFSGGWYRWNDGYFTETSRLNELSYNIVEFVKSELQIPTNILVQDLIIKGKDGIIKSGYAKVIDARENKFIAFHGSKDPPDVFWRKVQKWKTTPFPELWTVVLNGKNKHKLYWPIAYALQGKSTKEGWIYVFEFQLNDQRDMNWISLADCNGQSYDCDWAISITTHGGVRDGSKRIQARTGYDFDIVKLIYPSYNGFHNYPDSIVIPANAMLLMKHFEIKAAFKVYGV